MEIIASDRALDHVREHGGELWVWLGVKGCCSGTGIYLEASCEAPPARRDGSTRPFDSTPVSDVKVHTSLGGRRPPAELHVDVRGRLRPRVEAYWNGCVFVVDGDPLVDAERS